jgi:2'-5' RNA ligase
MSRVAAASTGQLCLQSAVLIPVPEAEPVIGQLRTRLDPAAGWGVPAHVTVLFPFVAPDAIDGAVIERVAAAVASVRAFDCEFARTGWFDEDVLWLAPEPAWPFRALISAAHSAFPQYPPFGGAYADLMPHLTVGHRPAEDAGALRAADAQVGPSLPIRANVTQAWLMTGAQSPDSWHTTAELPLGK